MRCWIISILLVLMGSSYIHSQQASDKVSYEGQTVAVVDLVANPRISVDSLRPSTTVRPAQMRERGPRRGLSSRPSRVRSARLNPLSLSSVRASTLPSAVSVQLQPY